MEGPTSKGEGKEREASKPHQGPVLAKSGSENIYSLVQDIFVTKFTISRVLLSVMLAPLLTHLLMLIPVSVCCDRLVEFLHFCFMQRSIVVRHNKSATSLYH